ncbi:cyclopropane-fatty-acyl-phospholipid synthase family protein [Tsuneonella sp. YG55]|uniref:Cyclopropane-fatty-acyl-phospholipid synthase family protein n=1 Tax=Tsuneonella litorea TaxID=2976475 RepID=A0A9X2W1Z1_9SPHN|nr:cyclopropane-fatty-acyl-phospholipid synthase family protein [Tsuneonella litorea]MCT2559079.1 cyclopropane-fatty-acyl-phospholipid synthase family protein [Tsuneonella litorea]
MAMIDRVLGAMVKRGVLEIEHADGRRVRLGEPADGYPEVGVRFADGRVARDLLLDPRLGAAEAFMDGRLLIERGDVMDLVALLRKNNRWDHGKAIAAPTLRRRVGNWLSAGFEAVNRQSSAKANVAHHYDIGNDLYERMLDSEYMQYSCAYWPRDDMSLEQAQEAKLAHIAAKLALAPGQRVLDIGCGWGGMAIYLARHARVTVTGITLSEEQAALARQRVAAAGVADRVRIELIDYRDMAARGDMFDRIVSVGMFEHVGVPQFETFFRACARLLDPDGVMLLHTIGRFGKPGKTDAFTRKYIFPGGYIPAMSETLAASEKVRLMPSDIEILRLHYARTLREWYARCVAHKDYIEEAYGPRFFRMWTFYLAGATASFESGGMCNFQIQYIRRRETLPITRGYIADAEAALPGGS